MSYLACGNCFDNPDSIHNVATRRDIVDTRSNLVSIVNRGGLGNFIVHSVEASW